MRAHVLLLLVGYSVTCCLAMGYRIPKTYTSTVKGSFRGGRMRNNRPVIPQCIYEHTDKKDRFPLCAQGTETLTNASPCVVVPGVKPDLAFCGQEQTRVFLDKWDAENGPDQAAERQTKMKAWRNLKAKKQLENMTPAERDTEPIDLGALAEKLAREAWADLDNPGPMTEQDAQQRFKLDAQAGAQSAKDPSEDQPPAKKQKTTAEASSSASAPAPGSGSGSQQQQAAPAHGASTAPKISHLLNPVSGSN